MCQQAATITRLTGAGITTYTANERATRPCLRDSDHGRGTVQTLVGDPFCPDCAIGLAVTWCWGRAVEMAVLR